MLQIFREGERNFYGRDLSLFGIRVVAVVYKYTHYLFIY